METAVDVQVIEPMPRDWGPRLWDWLHEVPDANLDDYSPKTWDEFRYQLCSRFEDERFFGVLSEGKPVGVIAYRPLSPRLGVFHGICLTRHATGKGIGTLAVRTVLQTLYREGVEKVCAYFFADNVPVRRMFDKLGAVEEGLQMAQTVRHGLTVDLQLMACFRGVV